MVRLLGLISPHSLLVWSFPEICRQARRWVYILMYLATAVYSDALFIPSFCESMTSMNLSTFGWLYLIFSWFVFVFRLWSVWLFMLLVLLNPQHALLHLRSDHMTVSFPPQVNAKPWSWTLPTPRSNPRLDSHWTRPGRPSRTRTCEWPRATTLKCWACFWVCSSSHPLCAFVRERLRTHSIESSGKLKLSPEQHWDFTAEDLKDLGEIGRGAYGSVNKMVHKPSNKIMAVKVIYLLKYVNIQMQIKA